MLKHLAFLSALVLLAPGASASPLPAYPFVHVSAAATRYTTPNIGALDFEVAALDAEPGQARAAIEERMASVRALLAEQGVPEADLETRDVRRQPRQDAAGQAGAPELRVSVHLIVRDLSKWRAIVAPLLDMPNLNSFGTSFDLVERDAFEAELMAEALRDARRRAELIAKGARRKLGAVTGVTPGTVKNVGAMMGLTRADFSTDRAKSPNVGNHDFLAVDALKLVQPVDVVFRLD